MMTHHHCQKVTTHTAWQKHNDILGKENNIQWNRCSTTTPTGRVKAVCAHVCTCVPVQRTLKGEVCKLTSALKSCATMLSLRPAFFVSLPLAYSVPFLGVGLFSFLKKFHLHLYASVCVGACKARRSPEAGAPGDCKLFYVGVENQIQVL